MRHVSEIVDLLFPPLCVCCSKTSQTLFCAVCEHAYERTSSGMALFEYGGSAQEAVLRAKSRGGVAHARRLAAVFAEHFAKEVLMAHAIFFVPQSRGRKTGHHLPHLLAQALGRSANVSVSTTLGWATTRPKQALLPRAQRLTNLVHAMDVRDILHGHVVLVDDVTTSGSTLKEGERALRAAGASLVQRCVLAKKVE